eukprot:4334826-Amphidinium_carterae.4
MEQSLTDVYGIRMAVVSIKDLHALVAWKSLTDAYAGSKNVEILQLLQDTVTKASNALVANCMCGCMSRTEDEGEWVEDAER